MLWIEYMLKGFFVCWLIFMSVFDIKFRKIPIWGLIIAGVIAICGAINRLYSCGAEKTLTDGIVGSQIILRNELISIVLGIIPGIIVLILCVATRKVGMADGVLICLMGLLETYLSCVVAFCVASFLMALFSIFLLAIKRVRRNTQLPFIPFITVGYVTMLMLFFL